MHWTQFFSQGKLELERELYQFGYSQVGAVVCVCVWRMSGCEHEHEHEHEHVMYAMRDVSFGNFTSS